MNRKKDCQDRREAIAALVLGELEGPAADELRRHLETCPACRQFHQTLTDEELTISSAFQILADSAALREKQLISQLNQLTKHPKSLTHSPTLPRRLWKGIKIMPKISKIAAVFIFAAALTGFFAVFTSTGGNLVFADVLHHIQRSSYTFNMTFTRVKTGEPVTAEVKFHRSGKLRVDGSGGRLGEISTIADIRRIKTLVIFHQQKTAQYLDTPENENQAGPLDFLARPAEALWNLRDGSEQRLESRQIEGQKAEGFKVVLQEELFRQEITIWAHSQTGIPLLVEFVVTSLADPEIRQKIIFSDFNFDVEFDESLFGLPPGYILGGINSLEEIMADKADLEPSPAGLQLEKALTLWAQNQKDQAAELFLTVDFSQPVRFSRNALTFTLTEKEVISLKAEDRAKLMDEIMVVIEHCRALSRYVVALGQTARAENESEKAERYFRAIYHFGSAITGPDDAIANVRMLGYAITIYGLRELVDFYAETNDQQQLQWAQQQLQSTDAARIEYRDSIVKN
ncbi:MAG: hypothetical protein AMJ79_10565 [Phycisphaerae bacterium SM23_30]|nr:MAG: hypothetical protein AMJ79_10565 [Phycisphaerae bacterium SM23_30]